MFPGNNPGNTPVLPPISISFNIVPDGVEDLLDFVHPVARMISTANNRKHKQSLFFLINPSF
jgi:hypothetical protein